MAFAALRFADNGYHPTSVAEIVQGMGVGKGVFYWYFSSKEELLSEILRDAHLQLRRTQQAAIADASDPVRRIELGILASLGICTALYIAVAIVLIGIVPYQRLNVADPLAVGIDATGLRWFSPVLKVSALFGLFSTMLVTLLGQTRIFFSMSRDGLLPGLFQRVHPSFRTPHISTAVTGSVVAVAAAVLPINVLSVLVSMGTLLAFVLVCIGILILRKTSPELERPFRTPGLPWVPILGTLFCLAQMVSLPVQTWVRLLIWLAIGMVIYFSYGRKRAAAVREGRIAVAPIDPDLAA